MTTVHHESGAAHGVAARASVPRAAQRPAGRHGTLHVHRLRALDRAVERRRVEGGVAARPEPLRAAGRRDVRDALPAAADEPPAAPQVLHRHGHAQVLDRRDHARRRRLEVLRHGERQPVAPLRVVAQRRQVRDRRVADDQRARCRRRGRCRPSRAGAVEQLQRHPLVEAQADPARGPRADARARRALRLVLEHDAPGAHDGNSAVVRQPLAREEDVAAHRGELHAAVEVRARCRRSTRGRSARPRAGAAGVPATFGVTVAEARWTDWIACAGAGAAQRRGEDDGDAATRRTGPPYARAPVTRPGCAPAARRRVPPRPRGRRAARSARRRATGASSSRSWRSSVSRAARRKSQQNSPIVTSEPSTIMIAPAATWSAAGEMSHARLAGRVDVVERAAAEDEDVAEHRRRQAHGDDVDEPRGVAEPRRLGQRAEQRHPHVHPEREEQRVLERVDVVAAARRPRAGRAGATRRG